MAITLKTRTKSVVGLDIQANTIAAAETSPGQTDISRAAISSLPTGLVREGEILDQDGLSDALKSFFREYGFNRRVRLGVANHRVVVRALEVPALDDREELDAAVRFKAGDQLPMPLEEAVIDYQVTERVNGGSGGSSDRVILVAAPREMIERIVSVARKAGLKLEGIDLAAFALIRALHGTNGNGALAGKSSTPDADTATVDEPGSTDEAAEDGSEEAEEGSEEVEASPVEAEADLDEDKPGSGEAEEGSDEADVSPDETEGDPDKAESSPDEAKAPPEEVEAGPEAVGYCHLGAVTSLAVAHGATCAFARAMSYSTDSMAEELADRRDISVSDARKWLSYVGLNRSIEDLEGNPDVVRETREVLELGASKLADELQASLDYYSSQPESRRVARTLVTGPGSEIDGLVDAVGEHIPGSVEVSAPRIGQEIAVPPALIALAYGLALDEVIA